MESKRDLMRSAGALVVVAAGAVLSGCPPIPGLGEAQPTPAEIDGGILGGASDAGRADAGPADAGPADAGASDAAGAADAASAATDGAVGDAATSDAAGDGG